MTMQEIELLEAVKTVRSLEERVSKLEQAVFTTDEEKQPEERFKVDEPEISGVQSGPESLPESDQNPPTEDEGKE